MTEKFAYELYLMRLEDEKEFEQRYGYSISLGDAESDWHKAERLITFFNSSKEEGFQYMNIWEDNFRYWAIYQKLLDSIKV